MDALTDERFPEYVRALLEARMDDHEYSDNPRICRVWDAASEGEYRRSEADGCCGSYDEQVWSDGVAYRIGFNYGH